MSLLPSCKEVARLVSDSLDSGRPLGLHAKIHLGVCEVCRRLLAQFELLRRGAASAPDAGPCLTDAAKERLKRSLGE